jgi:peptide/nickel transport system permease protein
MSARLPLLVLAGLVLMVLLGPVVWPLDPDAMNLALVHVGPGRDHPLGTDASGRDVLSRLLAGGQVSLLVGALAMAIAIVLGTMIGLVAGWRGGWMDAILMRGVDTALAIPTLFVVILALTFFGSTVPVVVVALGATSWMGAARVVRAEARILRTQSFVEASRALGQPGIRVVLTHLLPQLVTTLRVAAPLGVGTAVLTESALSFLGLGVQPPTASWGNMLSDAQVALSENPALAMYPGLLIFCTVAAVNSLGEAWRPREDSSSVV